MIRGVRYWDDESRYYTQTNNSFETYLRRRGEETWLETCGPTSATMLVDMMGQLKRIVMPGGWEPQREDLLMLWFNDPRNNGIMQKLRPELGSDDYPGNQVPQYYPPALQEVFGVAAQFKWVDEFAQVALWLQAGHGVMLCLKSPGHYVAAVAADEGDATIIYHDPWKERTGKGFGLRMGRDEYESNVKNFGVLINKES